MAPGVQGWYVVHQRWYVVHQRWGQRAMSEGSSFAVQYIKAAVSMLSGLLLLLHTLHCQHWAQHSLSLCLVTPLLSAGRTSVVQHAVQTAWTLLIHGPLPVAEHALANQLGEHWPAVPQLAMACRLILCLQPASGGPADPAGLD